MRPDASLEAIRHAYRARVRAVHPDMRSGQEATFKRVSAAYEVLGDPARRRAYDRSRTGPAMTTASVRGPAAGRRAPDPSGNIPATRRPARVVMDASYAAVPEPARPQRAPADEWRSAGIVLRAIAIVLFVVLVGVAALILTGSRRGPGDPPEEQPFCKTPDGWVDCRALDPLSQY